MCARSYEIIVIRDVSIERNCKQKSKREEEDAAAAAAAEATTNGTTR